MTDHDGTYHKLYSNPHMMADLVQQFVDEPWVADLDFSHMEPVKTKFHIPGLPKRESDVVWRIHTQDGGYLYLLLLLEFQSEVDRWMVLRVIAYICLLWLQLLTEKQIPAQGPLPPVMPVVLYNGETPWLSPVRLRDLIGLPDDSPLWKYQPDGCCFLIDESRFSKENLELRDSLSALVFQLEQCKTPEDLPELAVKVIAWLERWPEFAGLKLVIAEMFRNAVVTLTGDQSILSKTFSLLEVPTMLQTRIEAWKNERKLEWTQDGIQIGEKKGRQEEAASMLLKQMRRKFGQTPDWVNEKVKAANLELIETWSDNFVFANSMDEVFAS